MTEVRPSGEAQRLHPMTLLQRLLVSIPALIVLLLPVLRAPDANAWMSLLSVVIYGFFVLPAIILRYHRFRYEITPREIIIQSGVLTRQHRSIPIERIQNIEIEQRLLPRLFGTARVIIETAGSSSTEGVLEYVGLAEARRIREVVRSFQRAQAAAPAADVAPAPAARDAAAAAPETADEEAAPAVLFTMPLSRVLLSGVFRFSLLYIVLIFSGMEYTGLDPEEAIDWVTRRRFPWLISLIETSPWLVILSTLGVVALFAWITGIAVNLNRYYGFRLSLEEGKLHRRHGLLTVSEGTIPLRKVQALVLRTNPLMRAFGWHALELQTMGLDTDRRGHQMAAPFAQLDDILALAPAIRPFTLPERFTPVSRLTIRRTFVRYTLLLLAVALPLGYYWRPALWALAALPLLLYLAVLQYRQHGYALGDGLLFIRRGVLRHYVWIIPAERFQTFSRTASPFQRRLGLASLYVDTAGAGALRLPVIVDLPAEAADALLEEIYGLFTRRMAAAGTPSPELIDAEELIDEEEQGEG